MIKNIETISKKDFNYLLSNPFAVVEKLDMLYFRVQITKVGVIPLKNSTGKVISDIDCITNTVYKEICEFVNNSINPVRNILIEKFGEGYIGFFYLPVTKYNKISYKNFEAGTFILSDWSYPLNILNADDSDKINDLSDILNVASPPILAQVFDPKTDISTVENIRHQLTNYIEGNINNLEFAISVIPDYTHDVANNMMEGIIFRNDKFQYQVSLVDNNDSINSDKSVKLSYRNVILNSIAEFYEKNKSTLDTVFETKESYVDKVSYLFLKYIDNTDIFSKYSFDPEDLLPPSNSYIGDIDFDMIADANVKLICKYNEVHKNIFRMFLHTFAVKTSENKFKELSPEIVNILNNLIWTLKYKNYKEILLNAYKSNN